MATTVQTSNTVAFPIEKSMRARRRVIDANKHTNTRLRLMNTLQTSLDLTQVLQLFFEEAQQSIELASLSYKNVKLDHSIDLGKRSRHSCHYKLITQQDNLGELVFTRSKRFSDEELQLLEMLLSALVCPIRNALMYKAAIQTALKDPLTGAGNRMALESTLGREIGLAARHGQPLAILVIDIDHFKSINDEFGHTTGDCVLKDVAQQLMHACRDTDATYRYGGEEFVVIMNRTDLDGALILAERIRKQIAEMTTSYDDNAISVTVSIGISNLQPHDSLTSLFDRADKALYSAKQNGRNRIAAAKTDNVSEALKA
jgi:diguanylate cyclase (GGDEF)-like protein